MPWRILLVLETSGGGSGRHVIDLAEGLLGAGHEVHVLYSRRRAEPGFEQELRGLVGVISGAVDMRRAPHVSDLTAVLAIRRYLAARGPFHIVHGHSSKGGALARLAATGRPAARVYTPHCLRTLEPGLSWWARLVYARIERLLARATDAVIAVSHDEFDHAVQIGIPRDKIHLVINGLKQRAMPSREEMRARLGIADEEVCVGFIGRMVPQKAPHRLIDAFAEAARDLEGLRLAMVGDGPLKQDAAAWALRLGIDGKITWVPASTGPAAFSAFDIFALPSLYEAMPYVLLEATAAGLPIVATAVGGVSSVVSPGRNGYIVANWDMGAFAEKLRRLATDGDLRCALGKASFQISRDFTVERMLRETLEVYREALAHRKGAKAAVDHPVAG